MAPRRAVDLLGTDVTGEDGMRLPYVIDNRAHNPADVLNDLLRSETVQALDVATAYFNVGGFDLLRSGLEALASFRLLLGS